MPTMSDSWERVGADDPPAHLAGDDDEGHGVHVGRGDAGHRVRGARPRGDDGHAGAPGGAGVAVGHVHGPLLVAGEHVGDLVGVVQRVVELDGLAARVAEHRRHPLGLEAGDDGLGAKHGAALLGRARARTPGRALGGGVAPDRRCRLALGRRCRACGCSAVVDIAHRMIAPLSAEVTSFAYLANTPASCLGAGGSHAARRRASSSFAHVQRQRAALDVHGDGIALADEGDGAAGRRLGAHVPHGRPLGGAGRSAQSVIRATEVESPMPQMAEVGASISRMPGPPAGPS